MRRSTWWTEDCCTLQTRHKKTVSWRKSSDPESSSREFKSYDLLHPTWTSPNSKRPKINQMEGRELTWLFFFSKVLLGSSHIHPRVSTCKSWGCNRFKIFQSLLSKLVFSSLLFRSFAGKKVDWVGWVAIQRKIKLHLSPSRWPQNDVFGWPKTVTHCHTVTHEPVAIKNHLSWFRLANLHYFWPKNNIYKVIILVAVSSKNNDCFHSTIFHLTFCFLFSLFCVWSSQK